MRMQNIQAQEWETRMTHRRSSRRRGSVKRVFLRFLKIYRKTPVPEFIFNKVS